jgi:hypothetical protein
MVRNRKIVFVHLNNNSVVYAEKILNESEPAPPKRSAFEASAPRMGLPEGEILVI